MLFPQRPVPHAAARLGDRFERHARGDLWPSRTTALPFRERPYTWVNLRKLKVVAAVNFPRRHGDPRDRKLTTRVLSGCRC